MEFSESRRRYMRRHDLVREPDAGNLHVRFDERRLETEPWRGVRHRHRRKPPGTATPSAYRHRASRRLYTNLVSTLYANVAGPEPLEVAYDQALDLYREADEGDHTR